MAAKKAQQKPTRPAPSPKPKKKPTPPTPPPPEIPLAERLAQVRAGLETVLVKLWANTPVITFPSLDGVTVRAVAAKRFQPHWHLVTSGLASDGCELSLKVPRSKEEVAPPAWAQVVLGAAIGEAKRNGLTPSQLLPMVKGLGQGPHNDFESLAVALDPDFGLVGGIDLRVPVYCLVGLMADEVRLVREWSVKSLLEVYLQVDPLGSCSADRASLLMSPRTRMQLEAKVEREGSSMESFEASVSEISGPAKAPVWQLDVGSADVMTALLKGRTGHGRPFVVRGDAVVTVRAAEAASFQRTDAGLTLSLTLAAARSLRAQLRGAPGLRPVEALPGLTVSLVDVKAGTL